MRYTSIILFLIIGGSEFSWSHFNKEYDYDTQYMYDNNCFFDWEVLAIKYSNFEVEDIALHFETWNLLDFQTKHSKMFDP